jgi:uroporphyrinogen-III synthase
LRKKKKKMTKERQKKVKSILISQPEPENKTPYHALAEKHKLKLHYRSFVQVDEISTMEFREQRVSLLNHDSVIFTSKNSMDHYFGMMEKLRLRIPDHTKYFCVSEAIAHYLQNFIVYRKRKVFTGERTFASLLPLLEKHKDSKFLLPCSDLLKEQTNKTMEESGFDYTKAVMYKVVAADLSDLSDVKYDFLAFFSPTGIKSLYENFPDFVQNETRIAVFGPTTIKAVEDHDLIADIQVPNKKFPSMSMALDDYITKANKRKRK